MYRQSFFLVVMALLVMGILSGGTRIVSAIPGLSGLPSSYDPKINVQEAIMTSEKPLLIEFYTDSCRTCQHVTPWVHQLGKKYKDDFQFVMVDADNPDNAQVSQIFAIEYVPAIFIFDFKHMTKAQVDTSAYGSYNALDRGIQKAWAKVKKDAATKAKKAA